MAIFVDDTTKVLVQGLTGGQGRFHGLRNRDYGTKVVAGVTPGKGGQDVEGIPVFDSVAEAVAATGANASFISVPPKAAPAAILEAAAAGVPFVVCITEGIPAHDEAHVFNTLLRSHPATRLLGPNCPGIISPGKCNIGITAGEIAEPGGPVGIVSRSGTLTYQALYELKQKGIGVTTCVGIGGDPVPGTSFIDCLREFQRDPDTRAVMMIGEIGGSAEEEAAAFIAAEMDKPVVAYVAGVTAPAGKKMGHAGAIVSGGKGTAQGKMDALAEAGVTVAREPDRGRGSDGRGRRSAVGTTPVELGRGRRRWRRCARSGRRGRRCGAGCCSTLRSLRVEPDRLHDGAGNECDRAEEHEPEADALVEAAGRVQKQEADHDEPGEDRQRESDLLPGEPQDRVRKRHVRELHESDRAPDDEPEQRDVGREGERELAPGALARAAELPEREEREQQANHATSHHDDVGHARFFVHGRGLPGVLPNGCTVANDARQVTDWCTSQN